MLLYQCSLFKQKGGQVALKRRIIPFITAVFAVIAAVPLLYLAYSQPTRLTIAVGPADSYDSHLIDAIALRLQNRREAVQLKVIYTNGSAASSEALDSGKVDLAVIRGDLPKQPNAGLVITLHRDPVIFLTAIDSGIKNISDIKGRRIGVIRTRIAESDALSVNTLLLKTILEYYALDEKNVTIVPVLLNDAAKAFEDRRIDVIFSVGPSTEPTLSRIVAGLSAAIPYKPVQEENAEDSEDEPKLKGNPDKKKGKAKVKSTKKEEKAASIFIPISEPDAIIVKNPLLVKDEIVRGVFSGIPPTPPDAIPTLSVTHSIAANNNLSDSVIADLARSIIKLKPVLARETKLAGSIEVPSSDKNAAMPLHPGAAAYIDNEEQTFFDKYGDMVYILATLLGVLGSGFAALLSRWSSNSRSAALENIESSVSLVSEVRLANTIELVDAIELKADQLVEKVVRNAVQAHLNHTDLASFNISINHVRQALNDKRRHLIWNLKPDTTG